MLKRLLGWGVVVVIVGTSFASASAKRVTGMITAVGDSSVQIKTLNEHMGTVKLDERTDYLRWITHQPWQQDDSASSRWLDVGRCVEVEVRSDDAGVARIVRINADGAGTLWDPCKRIR
jgi:hypothetical protein